MARKRQVNKLNQSQRFKVYDWLKDHAKQDRVHAQRLTYFDLAKEASKALTFAVSEYSVADILKELGVATPMASAKARGLASTGQLASLTSRLAQQEHLLRLLYQELGKPIPDELDPALTQAAHA